MREIGGYLQLDMYCNTLIHEDAIKLNSARNCLAYLIEARGIKRIQLPYFLCDTVGVICEKYGVEIQYYTIDDAMYPIIHAVREEEWIYVVNYYGQFDNSKLNKLKQTYQRIIVDNCQSYFQFPVEHTDTIYSCRKYFGVPDGAFLYTEARMSRKLEQDVSYDRMCHIMGRMEKTASEFYPVYLENENKLEECPVMRMSKLTENLLRGINYETVQTCRNRNYAYLHSRFQEKNKLRLADVSNAPFMYPFLVEGGRSIRKRLLDKKIYIPTLWPEVFRKCEEQDIEYRYASDILPLPIDQRYDTEDMEYLYRMITEIMKEELI